MDQQESFDLAFGQAESGIFGAVSEVAVFVFPSLKGIGMMILSQFYLINSTPARELERF
jgi:hypothetical protein